MAWLSDLFGKKQKDKRPGIAPTDSPATPRQRQEKALCIIDLALPSGLVWQPNSLDEVLKMCAFYCWNPVDIKYNFDEAHRYTVQNGQIVLCTDPRGPAIRFNLDVPPELAMEVTAFTKATWRELMNDMGQWGVNHFLKSYNKKL
jgi:hypothetical protein